MAILFSFWAQQAAPPAGENLRMQYTFAGLAGTGTNDTVDDLDLSDTQDNSFDIDWTGAVATYVTDHIQGDYFLYPGFYPIPLTPMTTVKDVESYVTLSATSTGTNGHIVLAYVSFELAGIPTIIALKLGNYAGPVMRVYFEVIRNSIVVNTSSLVTFAPSTVIKVGLNVTQTGSTYQVDLLFDDVVVETEAVGFNMPILQNFSLSPGGQHATPGGNDPIVGLYAASCKTI